MLPAYAPVVSEKGIVTLSIDSWYFDERMRDRNGRNGEWDAYKKMIWQGQVLFGMMIFDEHRAVDIWSRAPKLIRNASARSDSRWRDQGMVAGRARPAHQTLR